MDVFLKNWDINFFFYIIFNKTFYNDYWQYIYIFIDLLIFLRRLQIFPLYFRYSKISHRQRDRHENTLFMGFCRVSATCDFVATVAAYRLL